LAVAVPCDAADYPERSLVASTYVWISHSDGPIAADAL